MPHGHVRHVENWSRHGSGGVATARAPRSDPPARFTDRNRMSERRRTYSTTSRSAWPNGDGLLCRLMSDQEMDLAFTVDLHARKRCPPAPAPPVVVSPRDTPSRELASKSFVRRQSSVGRSIEGAEPASPRPRVSSLPATPRALARA
jgi:hypothetical protein